MKVGIQLYTIRHRLEQNPVRTLHDIAETGYKAIECANHDAYNDYGCAFGLTSTEFKKVLDDTGLDLVGAHVSPSDEKKDLDRFYRDLDYFKKIIDYYKPLGARHLSIVVDFFPTLDYLKERCEVYNKLGALLKENGMKLLYHNHWHEFQTFDGIPMFDYIMEYTDPEYLGIELDAYWTQRGAYNPAEKIRQYGSRISLLHEKDFPFDRVDFMNSWSRIDRTKPVDKDTFDSTNCEDDFIEVGDGMIKIQDVIDAGNEFQIPYILVEQDFTKLDELDSIKKSMSNFRKMRGLDWD